MKKSIPEMNLEEFKLHYNEIAPGYPFVDDFSPAGSHWHRTEFYLKHITDGQKILDVGCSNGGLLKYLSDHFPFSSLYAVDVGSFFVENAQRLVPRATCITAVVEELPFPDENFDVVIAGEVLEHVLDIEAALKQVVRVLKTGGVLLATTPRDEAFDARRQNDIHEQHVRHLGPKEFAALLPGSVTEETNPYSWLTWYRKP